MPQNWIGFAATLREMQPQPFAGFTPVRTPPPDCPKTVRVSETLHYSTDGSNMFLLDEPLQPDSGKPNWTINEGDKPWIQAAKRQPVQTPLGWSLAIGRPLFWLTDNFVLPGHVAAWVLWRHRDTGTVWRASDPEDGNTTTPAGVWISEDASAPALAYLMPFPARTYPRWSELHHDTPGAQPDPHGAEHSAEE